MKEIKSREFSALLNVTPGVFAKLREQGVLPEAIETYNTNTQRGGGYKTLSWDVSIAEKFASKFDKKEMNKKHGFKKTIAERKKTGPMNEVIFNNLMRSM